MLISLKEYYIREQIKILQEEIGEDDEEKKEIKNTKRINKLKYLKQ